MLVVTRVRRLEASSKAAAARVRLLAVSRAVFGRKEAPAVRVLRLPEGREHCLASLERVLAVARDDTPALVVVAEVVGAVLVASASCAWYSCEEEQW